MFSVLSEKQKSVKELFSLKKCGFLGKAKKSLRGYLNKLSWPFVLKHEKLLGWFRAVWSSFLTIIKM